MGFSRTLFAPLLVLSAIALLVPAAHAVTLGACHADCTEACLGVPHECGDSDGTEQYFEHCCSCGGGTRSVGDRWNECLPGTRIEAEFVCSEYTTYESIPRLTGRAVQDSENCECTPGAAECIVKEGWDEQGSYTYSTSRRVCSGTWRWTTESCGEYFCQDGVCTRGCDERRHCVNEKNSEYTVRDCSQTRREACPNGCIAAGMNAGTCREAYHWPVDRPEETNGVTQCFGGHTGIDIGAKRANQNIPVKAVTTGIVEETGYNGQLGNYVIIGHYDGLRSVYGHLKEIRVSNGQHVDYRTEIGILGATGTSVRGNPPDHLHVELRFPDTVALDASRSRLGGGRLVNPCELLDCGGTCPGIPAPLPVVLSERRDTGIEERCKAACAGRGGPLAGSTDLCRGLGQYNTYFDEALALIRSKRAYEAEKAALLAVGTVESDLAHYAGNGDVKRDGTCAREPCARGIMQIRDSGAASECAGEIGAELGSRDANDIMRDPRKNILCGSYYLAKQLQSCNGDIAQAWGRYRSPAGCNARLGAAVLAKGKYREWDACLAAMGDVRVVKAGIQDELRAYQRTATDIDQGIADSLRGELPQDERDRLQAERDVIRTAIGAIDTCMADAAADASEAAAQLRACRERLIGVLSGA